MNTPTKNKSGFTLIELLIVIIIIGILAAVAVPKLLANINQSKAAQFFVIAGEVPKAYHTCLTLNGGAACSTIAGINTTIAAANAGSTVPTSAGANFANMDMVVASGAAGVSCFAGGTSALPTTCAADATTLAADQMEVKWDETTGQVTQLCGATYANVCK